MLYLTEKNILQLKSNFELAVQDCGVRKIMRFLNMKSRHFWGAGGWPAEETEQQKITEKQIKGKWH